MKTQSQEVMLVRAKSEFICPHMRQTKIYAKYTPHVYSHRMSRYFPPSTAFFLLSLHCRLFNQESELVCLASTWTHRRSYVCAMRDRQSLAIHGDTILRGTRSLLRAQDCQ